MRTSGALALLAFLAMPFAAPASNPCIGAISVLREEGVAALAFDEGRRKLVERIEAWAKLPRPESGEAVFVVSVVGLPHRGKTFLTASLREALRTFPDGDVTIVPMHGLEPREGEWLRGFFTARGGLVSGPRPRFVVIVETSTNPTPGLRRVFDRKSTREVGRPVDVHVAVLDPRNDVLVQPDLAGYDLVLVNDGAREK